MSTNTINNTSNSVGSTQTTSNTNVASQNILGKDDFLKLLVTQLQNQDPTQPTDDKETIAQMAQFSALEQMQQLNQAFTNFADSQEMINSSNMIGKSVTWTDTQADGTSTPKEGVVTAISRKDGSTQAVLADGTTVDLGSLETISEPTSA